MSLELAGGNLKAMPLSIGLEPEFTYSGIINRSNNYISAEPEGPYVQNQKIVLPLPFEYIDFRSSTIQMTISGVPAGGATFTRFNTDIRSIFQRIAVRFGSKYVLDSQNSNLLYNILDQTMDVNWESTIGYITTGTGDATQRNADFLNPNKVYAFQLYTNEDSFFYNVFPLQKLGVQMYIEFYLAPNDVCIETDVAGATYTVNNFQFHIASLVPSPQWDNLYNTRVAQGLNYTYFSYENLFDSSLLPAGTTRAQKVLNFKYSSLIGIIMVLQDSATLQSQTTLNKLNTFNFLGLNLLNLKYGSQQQPINSTVSLSDLLTMWAETMGLSMRFPFRAGLNYGTTNFIAAIPTAKFIKENRDENGSLNGLNTSIGTSLTLEMGFSAPLASAQTLNIFAIVENTITYNQNGSVTFYN